MVFSDSLALSASIPLFSVQNYPLGIDCGAKTKLHTQKLENLSKKRLGSKDKEARRKHEKEGDGEREAGRVM